MPHPYQVAVSEDDRRAESARVRQKHRGLLPVIVSLRERAEDSSAGSGAAPDLTKCKFMVAPSLTFAHFRAFVRAKVRGLRAHESLFAFVGNRHALPAMSQPMALVYNEHHDDDGFLYVTCAKENTFG